MLARIPGRDRSRRVVLAAHHDVVAGAPGAIDDGGAIAAILAAARSLHAGPPPACDVQLCVFDGEERGLLGSKAHLARQGAEGRAGLKAAVAVELVGWREDRLLVHTIPHGFAWNAPGIAPAWLAATVRRAADWADAPVGLGDPYASPWVQATVRLLQLGTGSDAGAYSARGLPAVMLSGSALTNFYEAYHLPGDAMDQVDPARLDDAARVLAAAAVELAALPADSAPPRLGTAYLTLGSRTLGAWTLRAIGLLAAMALVVAGAVRQLRGVGQAATFVAAAALAGLAAIPSVVGVLVVTPMALSAVAAPALPGADGSCSTRGWSRWSWSWPWGSRPRRRSGWCGGEHARIRPVAGGGAGRPGRPASGDPGLTRRERHARAKQPQGTPRLVDAPSAC